MKVVITQLDMPPPIPAAVSGGLSAQPGGQAGALVLPARVNIVTNVAAGSAVVLQILGGHRQELICAAGVPVPVYPTAGTMFQGEPGINVPITLPDGVDVEFTFDGVSTWYVTQKGSLFGAGTLIVGAAGCTITSGDGVPTSVQPNGSVYLRGDGTTGSRRYTSAGGGVWAAQAGV